MGSHFMTTSARIRCSMLLAIACLMSPLPAAKVKTQGGKDLSQYKSYQWLPPRVLTKLGLEENHVANPAVKEVILAHTYYNPVAPTSPEATVFRDADVLDFLGAVGFARIAAITGRDTPDLASSVRLSRNLDTQLPAKLITRAAQCNGQKRAAFLGGILETLQSETFGGAHQ